MAFGPITWQIDGEKVETVTDFIFLDSKITADSDYSHEIKIFLLLGESHDKPRQHNIKQIHHFANKHSYSQSYGFSKSHVWTWQLDHKEGWAPNNWCFWTVVLENPLDCKIKPVNPKGNQPWIFIGRNDAEAEAPIFWPPDVNSPLVGKDPDAGKDGGQEVKGKIED